MELRAAAAAYSLNGFPQHFLYLAPFLQGHGSLRPIGISSRFKSRRHATLSEAEQDAMEELRKALAVKNLEVAEKDAAIARLQKRCVLDSLLGECAPCGPVFDGRSRAPALGVPGRGGSSAVGTLSSVR
jgi:hypothetical protein